MTTIVENKDLIDRKAASRLLKISLRTLDRYRQSGRITTKIIDNRILLSKSEILELARSQKDKISSHTRHEKSDNLSRDNQQDNSVDREDTGSGDYTFVEARHIEQVPSPQSPHPPDEHAHDLDLIEMYQRMYEELSLELRKRQDELEGAHYRIGQLEGQLRYSVPLPEHKSEILKLTNSTQSLERDVTEKQLRLKKIREALYYETFNKRIYLAVIIGLLVIQPLWIYLAN